jgi:hypothetical protein
MRYRITDADDAWHLEFMKVYTRRTGSIHINRVYGVDDSQPIWKWQTLKCTPFTSISRKFCDIPAPTRLHNVYLYRVTVSESSTRLKARGEQVALKAFDGVTGGHY